MQTTETEPTPPKTRKRPYKRPVIKLPAAKRTEQYAARAAKPLPDIRELSGTRARINVPKNLRRLTMVHEYCLRWDEPLPEYRSIEKSWHPTKLEERTLHDQLVRLHPFAPLVYKRLARLTRNYQATEAGILRKLQDGATYKVCPNHVRRALKALREAGLVERIPARDDTKACGWVVRLKHRTEWPSTFNPGGQHLEAIKAQPGYSERQGRVVETERAGRPFRSWRAADQYILDGITGEVINKATGVVVFVIVHQVRNKWGVGRFLGPAAGKLSNVRLSQSHAGYIEEIREGGINRKTTLVPSGKPDSRELRSCSEIISLVSVEPSIPDCPTGDHTEPANSNPPEKPLPTFTSLQDSLARMRNPACFPAYLPPTPWSIPDTVPTPEDTDEGPDIGPFPEQDLSSIDFFNAELTAVQKEWEQEENPRNPDEPWGYGKFFDPENSRYRRAADGLDTVPLDVIINLPPEQMSITVQAPYYLGTRGKYTATIVERWYRNSPDGLLIRELLGDDEGEDLVTARLFMRRFVDRFRAGTHEELYRRLVYIAMVGRNRIQMGGEKPTYTYAELKDCRRLSARLRREERRAAKIVGYCANVSDADSASDLRDGVDPGTKSLVDILSPDMLTSYLETSSDWVPTMDFYDTNMEAYLVATVVAHYTEDHEKLDRLLDATNRTWRLMAIHNTQLGRQLLHYHQPSNRWADFGDMFRMTPADAENEHARMCRDSARLIAMVN